MSSFRSPSGRRRLGALLTALAVGLSVSAVATSSAFASPAGGAIALSPQVVAITSAPPTAPVVGGTYQATATGGGSNNPVVFSVDAATPAAACTVTAAGVVTLNHVGSCAIAADQAGNAAYSPAPTARQSFSVGKGSQIVAFTSPIATYLPVGFIILPAGTSSSGLPVTFSIDPTTTAAACSPKDDNGLFTMVHIGMCVIAADQAGNSDYTAAPTVLQSSSVSQGVQPLIIDNPPVRPVVGGRYRPVVEGVGRGLTATLSIDPATTAEACALDSAGILTFNHVGTCVLVASQAGNADYEAGHETSSFLVSQGPQELHFTSTAPTAGRVADSYQPTATSDSGQAVTFSVDPTTVGAACALNPDGSFTLIHVGMCVIAADQTGDADWAAVVPTVRQSFLVNKGLQTVRFTTTAPSTAIAHGTYAVSAVSSAGLPVAVSSLTPDTCQLGFEGEIDLTSPGTCAIAAAQAGDPDYESAPTVEQRFTISKIPQTVTFTPAPALRVGGTFLPSASSNSALPVALHLVLSEGPQVCTLNSAGVVTLVHVGMCVLAADQAGNDLYAAAPTVTQSSEVAKGSQKIEFTTQLIVGAGRPGVVYKPNATSDAGLPVTLRVDPSSTEGACALNAPQGTVTMTHVGTCVLAADQAGNDDYDAAPTVLQTIPISQASQKLSFTSAAPAAAVVGGSYQPTATGGSSKLPVTFTVDPSTTNSACTVTSAGQVTLDHVGRCVIAAHQAGNADYLAATVVTQSFGIAPGPLTYLVLGPQAASTVAGMPVTLTAEGFDTYGNDLGNMTAATTFTVTNGSCAGNVCTVTVATPADQPAVVTGSLAGKTGSATLTVSPGLLDHLTVSAILDPNERTSVIVTVLGFDQYNNALGVQPGAQLAITGAGSCTGPDLTPARCSSNTGGTHTITATIATPGGGATTSSSASEPVVLNVPDGSVTIDGASKKQPGYGSFATIRGTAPAGSIVTLNFHKAGMAATDYSIVRTVQTGSDGHWTRTIAATSDYRYYASIGDVRSDSVLSQPVPTLDGPAARIVVKNQPYTLTGTGIPGSTVFLHFHQFGTPADDYSIVRPVQVNPAGVWGRVYDASIDYRLYISRTPSDSNTFTSYLIQAR